MLNEPRRKKKKTNLEGERGEVCLQQKLTSDVSWFKGRFLTGTVTSAELTFPN